jgi:hypothetical protein
MSELTDVELLTRLQDALTPAPARPDEVSLARLHATLAELANESEPVSITTALERRDRVRSTPLRRRVTARTSLVAASALAFALTAGVAAAAVATNTLPGPTRAIAYDLGLPVTSPALFRAETSANQLHQAILTNNHTRERQLAHQLVGDLKTLNTSDLSQIEKAAKKLLVEVGVSVPKLPGAVTTPTTPTVTVPSVSVPSATVPPVTVPSVTVPSVTVPPVTVPSITVPSITVPSITVPSVTIPSVTIPSVTIPSVTIPRLP